MERKYVGMIIDSVTATFSTFLNQGITGGRSESSSRTFQYALPASKRNLLDATCSLTKINTLEELNAKLKGEIEQQNKQLQAMVNSLVSENLDLKKRITKTEQKLAELEKAVHDILEQAG